MTQPNPSPRSSTQQSVKNASRTRSHPEEKVPVEECLDGHARITSKELATTHFVKGGKIQNACSARPRVVADLVKSARMHIVRLIDEQPSKRSKKNDDKSAVAMLKKYELHDRTGQPVVKRDSRHELNHGPVGCRSSNTRHLGCVFQDMGPPKLSSILRKSSDMQKRIQRVIFTKAVARHTKIRDQNPSLGMICPGEPHQRSPNAPKFEDRSQEETEWQEQGAREAAWKLAKSVLKLKEKNRATSSHLRKIGACLHQLSNLRNENLLWTLERRCI